jgi:hypothetical protein
MTGASGAIVRYKRVGSRVKTARPRPLEVPPSYNVTAGWARSRISGIANPSKRPIRVRGNESAVSRRVRRFWQTQETLVLWIAIALLLAV